MKHINLATILLSLLAFATNINAAERFVDFTSGDFLLNADNKAEIYIDAKDCKGVGIAAANLATDINKVCGATTRTTSNAATARIIAGTIGHSYEIDRLVKAKAIDKSALKGKREKYIITIADGKLIIAGSDRRGTIYGIYELSRQIGVSPWYYWADTPVKRHERIYIKKGVYTDGEPVVRYRGIFLNDEAPCLTTWVKNTFGTDYGNHKFYSKVFELILRLKGNFLWPAMWSWAFYADDPLNSKTADEMGVMIGTSHHEPMARNHQEWARNRDKYGEWNYATNKDVIDRFFREGIERAKGTEDVITIGMRGDGDAPMGGAEGKDHEYVPQYEKNMKLMKNIFTNQRKIISDVTGRPAKETPQVWALYKEVLDYYDRGMKIPDDVTLLLCDDNWGNVRRVPSAGERDRAGGWGLYYHVDYVGAPRNSKWLNCTPPQNMCEQLGLAYDYGIDRLWILNVGDLKPMEYAISLFMDMAWNPKRFTPGTVTEHIRMFCEQQFGAEQADEAARIINLYLKYNGRVTPEMLDRNTYNTKTGEWRQVADDYMRLEAEALRQYIDLPEEYRDAYCELVLFPVQAMSNLYQMYYAQAMNHRLHTLGDPEANVWADRVERAFKRDSMLCAQYNHDIAGGKWNGMMTQKHIGYTDWNDSFAADTQPEVLRVADNGAGGFVNKGDNGYVAMEAGSWYGMANAAEATWTYIPYIGRTEGGMALTPYTKATDGASLSYRFTLPAGTRTDNGKVNVHIVVKSTLDFLNQGGLCYGVSIDGCTPQKVNFNKNLNEKPDNAYTVYYPTVARRAVESVVTLPLGDGNGGTHELTISPYDPGIVFEKIVVDYGGYTPSYLFMEPSERSREGSAATEK